MIEKHECKAVDNASARIKCVSMTDSKKWFVLFWQDGSSLMVRFCPFCGTDSYVLNKIKDEQ